MQLSFCFLDVPSEKGGADAGLLASCSQKILTQRAGTSRVIPSSQSLQLLSCMASHSQKNTTQTGGVIAHFHMRKNGMFQYLHRLYRGCGGGGGARTNKMIATVSICFTSLEYMIFLGDASNSLEYTYLLSDEL